MRKVDVITNLFPIQTIITLYIVPFQSYLKRLRLLVARFLFEACLTIKTLTLFTFKIDADLLFALCEDR